MGGGGGVVFRVRNMGRCAREGGRLNLVLSFLGLILVQSLRARRHAHKWRTLRHAAPGARFECASYLASLAPRLSSMRRCTSKPCAGEALPPPVPGSASVVVAAGAAAAAGFFAAFCSAFHAAVFRRFRSAISSACSCLSCSYLRLASSNSAWRTEFSVSFFTNSGFLGAFGAAGSGDARDAMGASLGERRDIPVRI